MTQATGDRQRGSAAQVRPARDAATQSGRGAGGDHGRDVPSEVRLAGEVFPLVSYRPPGATQAALLLFHGRSRNAAALCDSARGIADRHGLLVLAPCFDKARFPVRAYQRGGLRARNGRLLPPHLWTVRVAERLADWVCHHEGAALPISLWGHSAGAQYLSRVAAFGRLTPRAIVLSGASTYVQPSIGPGPDRAPDSLAGAFPRAEAEARLRHYLGLPITLYLGSEDTDPRAPGLSRDPAAMRQGASRYDRATTVFQRGKDMAEAQGWPFAWRLITASGLGHEGGAMLRAPEAEGALRLR